jgi:hypothetical protein
VKSLDRRLEHPREFGSQFVELLTDHLSQLLRQRIISAHVRQNVLHNPAVDPREDVFRAPEHKRLNQHQRRAQKEG